MPQGPQVKRGGAHGAPYFWGVPMRPPKLIRAAHVAPNVSDYLFIFVILNNVFIYMKNKSLYVKH